MKALVKAKKELGIWLEDVAIPKYDSHEVLIKIKKTAICGTDIHIYSWDQWAQATIPVPLIIGHEFMGEIVAVGESISHLKPGQRVSGEGHIFCGHCRNCRTSKRHLCPKTLGLGVQRPGCFAEYLVLPAANVIVLPEPISDEQAAILDPLGNAVHCALSFDVVGENVLITGAGPIGIMTAAIVRHLGARHVVITDIDDYHLQLAQKMGVTRAVNVQRESLSQIMNELQIHEGFTVGLEMSGSSSALSDMIAAMSHGGSLALLGILPQETTIDWHQVIFKGLTLKGIYGRELFSTWHKMLALLQSGLDISPVITHRFKMEDYQEAFRMMRSGQSGKVILDWSN